VSLTLRVPVKVVCDGCPSANAIELLVGLRLNSKGNRYVIEDFEVRAQLEASGWSLRDCPACVAALKAATERVAESKVASVVNRRRKAGS